MYLPCWPVSLQVTVPDPETLPRLLLRCERPATYPMKDPPYPTITAGHLSHDLCDWAQDELLQQFTPGVSHNGSPPMFMMQFAFLLSTRTQVCWAGLPANQKPSFHNR